MVLDGPRPVAHAAKELGIHDTALGNWVAAYRRRHGGNVPESVRDKSERELPLERENRKLREEVTRLSPLGHAHLNCLGRYAIASSASSQGLRTTGDLGPEPITQTWTEKTEETIWGPGGYSRRPAGTGRRSRG